MRKSKYSHGIYHLDSSIIKRRNPHFEISMYIRNEKRELPTAAKRGSFLSFYFRSIFFFYYNIINKQQSSRELFGD